MSNNRAYVLRFFNKEIRKKIPIFPRPKTTQNHPSTQLTMNQERKKVGFWSLAAGKWFDGDVW